MFLSYVVQYRKGRDNRAADALSRRWEEAELTSITTVIPTWVLEAKASYEGDSDI